MAAGTVTVLGATGKTGRAVAAAALRAGLHVRGTSRSAEQAGSGMPPPGHPDPSPAGGVSWCRVDLETGDGLAQAFAGADAAYLVMPNLHPDEVGAMTRAVRAALDARVGRVVYHSVADPGDARMPHHLRKALAEESVRDVCPDAVVLRPCAYQQNLTPMALAGHLRVAYRLDAPFSLVDLDDVAQVATDALAGTGAAPGSTHVLAGPEELTVAELAAQAGQVLGSPVTAEAVPLTAWREGPGAGLPEQEAQELAAMFAAYDETGFTADPAPFAALLGRRATTWAELLRRLSTNQRT